MLGVYIQKLYVLCEREALGRSEVEKQKIEDVCVQKILDEAEKFIIKNLGKVERNDFKLRLKKASSRENVEEMLTVMIHFLMEIPDVKYRLDNWMKAVIGEVHYKLIKVKNA